MPPPTQRRMLANITQHAESQHNRNLQEEAEVEQQGAARGPRKPANMAPADIQQPPPPQDERDAHMSYLQRQYHSVALSESIRAHNEYLQQQQQQGGGANTPNAPSTPSRTTNANAGGGRGPAGRSAGGNRRSPKEAQKAVPAQQHSSSAPHPYHADVDGNPCPCPDCNSARLQDLMAEGGNNHHQQQQQHDPELAMLHQQHHNLHQQHQHHGGAPIAYDYYGNPMSQHHHDGGYGNNQGAYHHHQQVQAGYRQHSPYAPVAVGYSPNNGYYGLPSMPNSPLHAGGYAAPEAASFEVPYIPPPRANYARFALAPEGGTPPSSEAVSPVNDGPTSQQQRRNTNATRQAPPRSERAKKDRATLSPTSAVATGAGFPAAAAAAAAEQPTESEAKAKKGPARKSSPTAAQESANAANARRSTSPPTATVAAAPRPPCPFAFKVRCSPWHVRSVVSPFELAVGDCVVFEGDRGKDAGTVVEVAANDVDPNSGNGRQIAMALAVGAESDAAAVARQEEDALATVPTAITLVEKLNLRMRVVGAVFQHDRQKLTFMYEAGERVDFRQLLRELYTEFRCRIWLEVPPGAHNPAAASATRGSAGGAKDRQRGGNNNASPASE